MSGRSTSCTCICIRGTRAIINHSSTVALRVLFQPLWSSLAQPAQRSEPGAQNSIGNEVQKIRSRHEVERHVAEGFAGKIRDCYIG